MFSLLFTSWNICRLNCVNNFFVLIEFVSSIEDFCTIETMVPTENVTQNVKAGNFSTTLLMIGFRNYRKNYIK